MSIRNKTYRGGYTEALGILNWIANLRGGFVQGIEDTRSIDLFPAGGGVVACWYESGELIVDHDVVEPGTTLLESDYLLDKDAEKAKDQDVE